MHLQHSNSFLVPSKIQDVAVDRFIRELEPVELFLCCSSFVDVSEMDRTLSRKSEEQQQDVSVHSALPIAVF